MTAVPVCAAEWHTPARTNKLPIQSVCQFHADVHMTPPVESNHSYTGPCRLHRLCCHPQLRSTDSRCAACFVIHKDDFRPILVILSDHFLKTSLQVRTFISSLFHPLDAHFLPAARGYTRVFVSNRIWGRTGSGNTHTPTVSPTATAGDSTIDEVCMDAV